MGEFAVTAILGTTVVVLAAAAIGAAAHRSSAASRCLVWQAALSAFWLVPLVCLAAGHVPAGGPKVRVALPDGLARAASARPAAGGSRSWTAAASASTPGGPRLEGSAVRSLAVPKLMIRAGPLLWLAGTCATLLLLLRSGLAVRRLIGSASASGDDLIGTRAAHWAQTMGVRHVPEVLVTERLGSPTVAGVRRPVLLLPAQVRAAATHLDAALIHELAHILRRDSAMQFLSRLTRALWWWHPLAWFAVRRLAETAEEASDDWVIALTGDRQAYAHAVTGWAEAACPAHLLACACRGRPLVRRVGRILDTSRTPVVRTSRVARWTALLGMVAAAIGVSCLRVGAGPAPGSTGSELTDAPSPAGGQRTLTAVRTYGGRRTTRMILPDGTVYTGPPPMGHITGQVFLPDGATPAVGALVWAENSNDGPQGPSSSPPGVQPWVVEVDDEPEAAPRTDADGRFSIPIAEGAVQPGEAFFVHVHLAGYAPLRSARTKVNADVRLVLPPGHLLEGQVLHSGGRPASGVQVLSYWPTFRGTPRKTGIAAATVTGTDGKYKLGPLGAGEYDLRVKGEEIPPVAKVGLTVPVAVETDATFHLPASAEIRGRVVYLGTQNPVSGVRVILNLPQADLTRRATSDDQGRFVLRGLPAGEHLVLLRKSEPLTGRHVGMVMDREGNIAVVSGEVTGGDQLASGEVTVKLAEGEVLERSFAVCDGGIIEGRVLGADGQPVPRAHVSLVRVIKSNLPDYTPASFLATHPVSFSSQIVAETDADGRFRVNHIWPRSYYVEARSPDRHYGVSAFFPVQDRQTASVEVTITDATSPPSPDVPQSLREEAWR
jgi:beta-lactamase regulating signal transducer with metallopeptidase domain